MLVITNQSPLRIGRQGRLAGSRQAEEDSDITILALVGGRVQGEHVVLDGHLVEEYGEDTLLHLAGVLGTKDDHLLFGKVDGDGSGGGHALGPSVCGEGSGVVDDIVWMEGLELLARGPDEHVAHEEGMVGTGADDSDADSVALVPAGIAVNDIDAVSGVEVVDSTFSVDSPDLYIFYCFKC